MAGVFKSLDLSDVRINPFRAYKKWYGPSGSLYTKYEGKYETDLKNLGATYPYIQSSDYSEGTDKLKGSIHHSTNHLFYQHFYDNTKAVFGSGNTNLQNRFIYDFVTTLSLPQNKVGESILPGSVKLQFNNAKNYFDVSGSVAIVDDLNGNLVLSSNMDATGSLTGLYDINSTLLPLSTTIQKVSSEYHIFRLPTERMLKSLNTSTVSESFYHPKGWSTQITYDGVTPVTSSRGLAIEFTGNISSSVIVNGDGENINDLFNFRESDFSLGFFMNFKDFTGTQTLLEKRNPSDIIGMDINGNVMSSMIDKYPYQLSLVRDGWFYTLVFRKSNGFETIEAALQNLSSNTPYYVWLTKSKTTGKYELAVQVVSANPDSVISTINITDVNDYLVDNTCTNKAPIYIGCNYGLTQNYIGFIEGLSFFNKYIAPGSAEQLFQIYTGGTNTLTVGNVFYKQGLLTLTDTRTYEKTAPYTNQYPKILEYRSTQTIYETEVSCTISPGEFGFSSNPSLHVYDPRVRQFKLRSFATGSDFRPYVTQIGLYDDRGRLLVVGKTSQPIKAPDNVDTTFVLKFDR
jgi:hypothetical protein